MTDDALDLTAVAEDDAALEQLRLRAVSPDDSALQLLRDLLVDIDRDVPRDLSAGSGSTVLQPADDAAPVTRVARGGTVVALLTAGVVAFGGVAAASTAVAPGNPLHGFGESVRSAAGAVVDAVKPPEAGHGEDVADAAEPATASAAQAPRTRPAVPARPGREVAVQARSDVAARQVGSLLDAASELLQQGRVDAASARLDVAERRLRDVTPAGAAPLQARLAGLRAQVEAAGDPHRGRPTTRPGKQAEPDPEPAGRTRGSATKPSSRPGTAREQGPPADRRASAPRQPSRLASVKPRA